MRARWGLNETSFDRCQCYLCVPSAVVSIHIKKIAAGEQAFVMDRSQLSNSRVVDCYGWQVVRGHEVGVSPDVQVLLTLHFAPFWHNLNHAIWVFSSNFPNLPKLLLISTLDDRVFSKIYLSRGIFFLHFNRPLWAQHGGNSLVVGVNKGPTHDVLISDFLRLSKLDVCHLGLCLSLSNCTAKDLLV